MTYHYPDLGSASDWSCCMGNLLQPVRSTTQIWVLMCHNYGIFALFSQTSFRGVTSGGVTKCWLFFQTKYLLVYECNARESSEVVHICILWHLHLDSFLYCWRVPAFNVSCLGKQISLLSRTGTTTFSKTR